MTRDFLQEADAIVWVFAIGQAAKATEKAALELAHDAGKRVLGVLNKVDRADAGEIDAVVAPRRALARRSGRDHRPVLGHARRRRARRAASADPALAALGDGAGRALLHAGPRAQARDRAVGAAPVAGVARARRPTPPRRSPQRLRRRGARALARLEQALRGALDGERVALRARMDEAYRRAALEVREFVRPRSWLFGEHRATAADEAFLGELLEDSVTGALARTRAALLAALARSTPAARPDADDGDRARPSIARSIASPPTRAA